MRTYTEYKLTNHQLERLSPIVKGRPHKHGMALRALENKKLVTSTKVLRFMSRNYNYAYKATEAGIKALADARKEGW
jgi:hypothetical protein